MTFREFKELHNSKKNDFKILIDNIIPKVDFRLNYSYDVYKNGNKGVLQLINGTRIWSWVNTINTNYSCLFMIVKECEKILGYEFILNNVKKNFNDFISILSKILNDNKEHFFTPGSEIFNAMLFKTQKTWNDGLSSIIASYYTLNKNLNFSFNLNYHRGDIMDMKEGVDFSLITPQGEKRCQHKKLDGEHNMWYMDGDVYFFGNYDFSDSYCKLDYLTIEKDYYLYIIKNSPTIKIEHLNNTKGIIVDKNLVQKMKIETDISDILIEINKVCFNKMIFIYEKDDTGKNYFIEGNVDGFPSITIFLNDPNDLNLEKMLTDKLDELKNRFD